MSDDPRPTPAVQAENPCAWPEARVTSDNLQFSIPNSALRCGLGTCRDSLSFVQSIARTPTDEDVARLIRASMAPATRRAYQGDVADFLRWGGTVPCTPEMLARYIAGRAAALAPATISRRVVGISRAHTSQGLLDPSKNDLVRAVLRGARREHGRPQTQVAPLLREDLIAGPNSIQSLKGLRDRAILLLGFAAALRRSELVAMNFDDLSFVPEGMLVMLRRSKTDQACEGRRIAVPYGRTTACPVNAAQRWLCEASIADGPLFRSINKAGAVSANRLTPQSIALLVKAYAHARGLTGARYSGHSLRAGLVTSAACAGVSLFKIQEQTGHRSLAMLHRYVRDAKVFEGNAAGLLL